MHVVIVEDEVHIRSVQVTDTADVITIGSSPDCHLFLPDLSIRDQHLQITRSPGGQWQLALCPPSSDAPAVHTRAFVNALEADWPHLLKHRDELAIARFRITFHLDDASAATPRSAVVEEASRIREHPLPSGAIVRKGGSGDLIVSSGGCRALAELAPAVNGCLDLASLLRVTIQQVMAPFRAHQVWMGVRRHGYGDVESVETIVAGGQAVREDPPRLQTFLFRCLERGQFVCCPGAGVPGLGSVLCVPLGVDQGVLGMLYIDTAPNTLPYEEQDLDLLTVLAAVVGRQLERLVNQLVQREEAIAVGEWSFIRELQAKMDLTNVPQWEGLQLAAYCKPGLDVASDVYDVMRLPNGLAAFLCGRIEGPPIRVALAMAELRAAFRMCGLHADPPHVLFRAVNWLLHEPQAPTRLTAAAVVMNPRTGVMQYAATQDAGVLIIAERGEPRDLQRSAAPPIGGQREFPYAPETAQLDVGESLVLYTPGCLRVRDSHDRALGEDRLVNALADLSGQGASSALDELLSELKPFFNEGRASDDVSLIFLHRA